MPVMNRNSQMTAPTRKIRGYIGAYHEGIDGSLKALVDQTYPLDEILVVDNGSTQWFLKGPFPDRVTLIRNKENLGPSGAITTAFEYAMKWNYDWIWVLDADSVPHKDSLEKLIRLYESFDSATQNQIGILSCSQVLIPTTRMMQGRRLTSSGPRPPRIDTDLLYCECDAIIWSGCLYKMEAITKVGMPRCGKSGYWEDLGHDYGDMEFSYRIKKAGFRILVHRFSFLDHPVGQSKGIRFFGKQFLSTNHPPSRRYLFFRNLVFFWLYLFPNKNWIGLSIWFVYRLSATIFKILLVEDEVAPKISACFRGSWDGLRKNLNHLY